MKVFLNSNRYTRRKEHILEGWSEPSRRSSFGYRSEASIEFSIISMQDPIELPLDMASASLARAVSCRRKSRIVFSTDHLTWESAFFCVKPNPFSKESNYSQLKIKLYWCHYHVNLPFVMKKNSKLITIYKPFLCHQDLLQKIHI